MRTRTPPMNRFLLAALVTGFVPVAAPAWGQVINEEFKILPTDGAAHDDFGWSIAIDNGVVAVGARFDADNGDESGSAYLFDALTGDQIAKLLPNDGAWRDWFGVSIAIDDGIVAVGAWWDDDNGSESGSAYLFDASTGTQIAKLLPSDGAAGDWFGFSMAVDDGVVAIGAWRDDDNGLDSGSAYLFDAFTGVQLLKLLPSDGSLGDFFGYSIAIDDGVVAVGAIEDDDNGERSGSAYLFDALTGAQIAKLLPNDGAAGDEFGESIGIDSGVVVVGAQHDDDNGIASGSAYLFDAITGAQIAKLLPSDGEALDKFGSSVAIGVGVVVIGAMSDDDNGERSGSAYLFDALTGAQVAKLLPSDGAENDGFGFSVAIDDGVAVAGALGDDDNGERSGSAYLFLVDGSGCVRDPEWVCDGDVDGDGQVNPVDSGLVMASFGSVDEQSLCNYDMDCDGQINPVDSGIVQSLFGTCEAPREVCP